MGARTARVCPLRVARTSPARLSEVTARLPAARTHQCPRGDFRCVRATTCRPDPLHAAVARTCLTTCAFLPALRRETVMSPGPCQVSSRAQVHTA
ncbi:hypothetical protein GT030_08280 [Streptomyces sp. SID1328]|uniref:hypothetical protein n=1 Tax=Streptomyces sp. SID1328 TaxID=2690250 RepID=UPI00136E9F81|nr:hypothetical protein [Streptomyces sp. SID1328]MYV38868.1 hypothetical protein [Streptomyces sp. SID1328]